MHVEFKLSNTDVILTAPSCPAFTTNANFNCKFLSNLLVA
jgi:hypothetical protein